MSEKPAAPADGEPESAKPPGCWKISGETEIALDMKKEGVLPYSDNIEMSGRRVSGIISYAIDEDGGLALAREIYFPQLHEYGTSEGSWFHDYRAYLKGNYSDEILPKLYIGDKQFVPGPVENVIIDGTLKVVHAPSKNGLRLTRILFPSMDQRIFVERWTIQNSSEAELKIRSGSATLLLEDCGAKGKFTRRVDSDVPDAFALGSKKEATFSIRIAAKMEGEEWPEDHSDSQIVKRRRFLSEMADSLQLETPDPVLNTLFGFSKIRASESIFESRLGLIHSPGGGRYYLGIWANDQAEYINPFFGYLGYGPGNESAMNAFKAFAGETNPDFTNIRYSFEVEGLVPPFPKDRGDAAMIAYGASQYALFRGDKVVAEELWPLIEWCLEYCHRNLNSEGVVKSESDEMEGRIETGTANLSTSSLYFGALDLAADLGRELGKDTGLLDQYRTRRMALQTAIENYFGAKVEGMDTYKYFKQHKFLRHWICLPLVVGIHERKEATIKALFDRLWTDNGVHVEKNSGNSKIANMFWDRGTLYALRGTFIAGETEISLRKLREFSAKRLLGDRVPYVVEAYPEGSMAQLSAESGLYCRIFVEGLFGIKPRGLNCFEATPRLPDGWDAMNLRGIHAFGENFDVEVRRAGDGIEVTTKRRGEIVNSIRMKQGETREFSF